MPKVIERYTCLSVILLDSIFVNSDNSYYPQIFLEECKYAVKKKKIINTIIEELKIRWIWQCNREFDKKSSINIERYIYK